MGITIHYSGQLDNLNIKEIFINELSDISDEMDWTYTRVDDEFHRVKGILINPHKDLETISFLFDGEGTLNNYVILPDIDLTGIDRKHNFIKTQSVPVDIHITLVKLLKYIKEKYISNLEVLDEGCYWETEDKALLQEKAHFIDGKIKQLSKFLSKIPKDKNDTTESIADKIERTLRKI